MSPSLLWLSDSPRCNFRSGCELLADRQRGAISPQRRIHLHLIGQGIANNVMARGQLVHPLGVRRMVIGKRLQDVPRALRRIQLPFRLADNPVMVS